MNIGQLIYPMWHLLPYTVNLAKRSNKLLSSLDVCHLLSVYFQFSYRQCGIVCFSVFYHLIRPCELILHIWNIPYIVYIKVLNWWLFFLGNQEFKVSATVLHCLSQVHMGHWIKSHFSGAKILLNLNFACIIHECCLAKFI